MNLSTSSAVSPKPNKLKLFIQKVLMRQEDNYNAQLSKNRWLVPAVVQELHSRTKPSVPNNNPMGSSKVMVFPTSIGLSKLS